MLSDQVHTLIRLNQLKLVPQVSSWYKLKSFLILLAGATFTPPQLNSFFKFHDMYESICCPDCSVTQYHYLQEK